MSDRTEAIQASRPNAARIGQAGSTWSNPLDKLKAPSPKPGPSSLPPKPRDPSGSQGKRSVSPEKGDFAPPRMRSPMPGRRDRGDWDRYLPPQGSLQRREPSPPPKRTRYDGPGYREQRHEGREAWNGSRRGDGYGGGGDTWQYDAYDEDRYDDRGGPWPHDRSDYAGDRPYRHDSRDMGNPQRYDDRRDARGGYDDRRDTRGGYDDRWRSRGDHYRSDAANDRRQKHSSGESSYRDHHRGFSGQDDAHRPVSPRRRRSRSRSRSRTRTPRREPEPEEGEIEDDEPPLARPEHDSLPSHGQTTAASSQASEAGLPYQPIKLKRPTNRASQSGPPANDSAAANGSGSVPTPPPPPSDSRPLTPPAPPTPPPPSDRPPTPPPPPVEVQPAVDTPKRIPPGPSSSVHSQAEPPQNKALDQARSQAKYDEHGDRRDGKTSVPHAPNRNLQNPSTRPSTPAAKNGTPAKYQGGPQLFRRPTADEELRDLHRTFRGTTTLAAYDLGDKLGEGTFGVVTKGVEISTKRAIALKKLITHNPRDGVSVTTVREIKIIKSLNHPNIVEIIDMVVERKNASDRSQRGDVFMVFPYMDHDLCGLLSNPDFVIQHSIAKLLFRQILEGMDFIHANNFIHRDIKTANILVDRQGGIKIADFGLARTWTFDKEMPKHLATEYTNMVVTRWYRAPELLLGDKHYGPAVDMWSLGCVLGEMYNRLPILQGDTDRDQLFKIFGRVGRPNEENFPGWRALPGFPESEGYAWDRAPGDQPLLQAARKWGLDRGGADLMMKLLRLDPNTRLTANDALDHGWFWCKPAAAVKSPDCIKVASSHEMTQRLKNDPPPAAFRQRPPQQQKPRQSGPPAGVWNNNGPPPIPRHSMPHNGGGMPNPYAQQQAAYSHNNFYGGPPPRNGPPFQNGGGHPPFPQQQPNMGMGMGMGMIGPPAQHYHAHGRPPLPPPGLPNRPPPDHGGSQSSTYRPPPPPFMLASGKRATGVPPPGIQLTPSTRQSLPPRPGPRHDAGRPSDNPLPYE